MYLALNNLQWLIGHKIKPNHLYEKLGKILQNPHLGLHRWQFYIDILAKAKIFGSHIAPKCQQSS